MRKIIGLVVLFVTLTFASCDKNQAAVKTLDGKWKAISTSSSAGSSSTAGSGLNFSFGGNNTMYYTFDNCKLKKDEYCNLNITTTIYGISFGFDSQYRVLDDGKTLETKSNGYISQAKIVDLKSKTMTLVSTDSTGASVTINFEKVDK